MYQEQEETTASQVWNSDWLVELFEYSHVLKIYILKVFEMLEKEKSFIIFLLIIVSTVCTPALGGGFLLLCNP